MDAANRRFRDRSDSVEISESNVTLPGLLVLGVGVLILIGGIVLMAAFGVDDFAGSPRQISGPIVLGVGGVMCLGGICYAAYLKSKHEKAEKQMKKVARQQAGASRIHIHRHRSVGSTQGVHGGVYQQHNPAYSYSNNGPMTTVNS